MIKKQQKWIALLVTLTFVWLLQVSAMPLTAAGTTEQAGLANAGQGTGFVEAAGLKAAPAPKRSILPYILIGVGVLAVAAVLIFVVFKTTYDVTGSWVMVMQRIDAAQPEHTRQTDFTGTKDSGTWVWANDIGTRGTYTVSGKTLTMVPKVGDGWNATISGTFTGKDAISGTWIQNGATWNITFTRGTTTTKIEQSQLQQTQLGVK